MVHWPAFLWMFLAVLLTALAARGVNAGSEPIEDNSFLIEEAYNQEPRVVQHILTWGREHRSGIWASTFTQEWPLFGQRHQLSYTIPFQRQPLGKGAGIGDVELHYRFQLAGLEGGPVAFTPRVTVTLPTGSEEDGIGGGESGFEAALALSVAPGGPWVVHSNLRGAWSGFGEGPHGAPLTRGWLLGHSVVYLARPRLNLLLELTWERGEDTQIRIVEETLIVSPAVRWAHDFDSGLQIVPGVALPIGLGETRGRNAVLLYLSFEHGF